MSKGGGLCDFTLGLTALVAALLCAWPASAQGVPLQVDQASEQAGQSEQETRQDRAPVTGPQNEQQQTAYQPDCSAPADHDAADYCEQRRMAQAALDSLQAMRDQNFLLWITVALSAGAAAFAWMSARAANLTLRDLERPHFGVIADDVYFYDSTRITGDETERTWRLRFRITIVNYGRMPGTLSSVVLGATIEPHYVRAWRTLEKNAKTMLIKQSGLLGPNDPTSDSFDLDVRMDRYFSDIWHTTDMGSIWIGGTLFYEGVGGVYARTLMFKVEANGRITEDRIYSRDVGRIAPRGHYDHRRALIEIRDAIREMLERWGVLRDFKGRVAQKVRKQAAEQENAQEPPPSA